MVVVIIISLFFISSSILFINKKNRERIELLRQLDANCLGK